MAILDDIKRVFREFKRYTGDSLPGEPTSASLPIGDPQSGVHSPKKSSIRELLTGLVEWVQQVVADAEIGIPADGAITRSKLTPALSAAISISVDEFGAIGNAGVSGTGAGVADDSTAFQAANDYLAARGGGTITYNKRHYIGANVDLSKNVTLKGPTGRADPGNPFSYLPPIWAAMQSVPALIISPTARISRQSGGGLSGVFAFRKGIKLDGTDVPSEFAGTAFITAVSDGTFVEHCSVVGFQQAFYDTDNSRTKFDDVLIDCNEGIYCANSGDINRYRSVHCYGVTQANATGHQSFSDRSGTAFYFGGSGNGGPTLEDCFAYSFAAGIFLDTPGSYTIANCWIDGTTDSVTGAPLVSTRAGLVLASDVLPNAEPQITNLKVLAQGTGISLRAGNYGAMQMSNIVLFQNNVGINCAGDSLNIMNLACRNYFTAGILFANKNAADTAKIVNGVFYDRKPGAIDINGGSGDPTLIACSYVDGDMVVANEVRTSVAPVSEALTVPNGKQWVNVTGTGNIGAITGGYDGRTITLQFISAGAQILGSNFRLASAFTALTGGTITLRYSRAVEKWVEVSRAN